jgi:hypothetical protein
VAAQLAASQEGLSSMSEGVSEGQKETNCSRVPAIYIFSLSCRYSRFIIEFSLPVIDRYI